MVVLFLGYDWPTASADVLPSALLARLLSFAAFKNLSRSINATSSLRSSSSRFLSSLLLLFLDLLRQQHKRRIRRARNARPPKTPPITTPAAGVCKEPESTEEDVGLWAEEEVWLGCEVVDLMRPVDSAPLVEEMEPSPPARELVDKVGWPAMSVLLIRKVSTSVVPLLLAREVIGLAVLGL